MNTKLAQIQEFINTLDNKFSEQQQFTLSVCAEIAIGGASVNEKSCLNGLCAQSVNNRRCTNQKGQCKESINWHRCKEKEIK
jgi:hypothetical protein